MSNWDGAYVFTNSYQEDSPSTGCMDSLKPTAKNHGADLDGAHVMCPGRCENASSVQIKNGNAIFEVKWVESSDFDARRTVHSQSFTIPLSSGSFNGGSFDLVVPANTPMHDTTKEMTRGRRTIPATTDVFDEIHVHGGVNDYDNVCKYGNWVKSGRFGLVTVTFRAQGTDEHTRFRNGMSPPNRTCNEEFKAPAATYPQRCTDACYSENNFCAGKEGPSRTSMRCCDGLTCRPGRDSVWYCKP